MKNKILSAALCLVLLAIYFACEKDDAFIKEQQPIGVSDQQKTPTIKNVSFNEVGETFNALKNRYQLDGFLQSNLEHNMLSRNTIDTLGITIYTDDIKEVTLDDYTSYTMLIALPESDSTKFYNLTIEDKNGEEGMFMTKYTPTQEWLDDKNKAYEGSIKTARIDVITQEFPPDGGGEIETNNTQYNDYSTPQGSPYYPSDCDGVVIITIEDVPYPCSCNPSHMPWESCGCELLENGTSPGYDQVPFYYCDVYGNEWNDNNNPNDTTNTNTNGPGGPSDNTNGNEGNDNESESLAGFVPPGETCSEPPPLSLNGDCIVDAYELLIDRLSITDEEERTFVLENTVVSDEIIEYLEDNANSEEAIEFASLAIDVLEEGGEIDFEHEIIMDSSIEDCVKNIINALINDNTHLNLGDMPDEVKQELNLSGFILELFNNSDNFQLTFKAADIPPNSNGEIVNATTNRGPISGNPGNFFIDITLNNSFIANATDLAITRTIIHESLHAYIVYIYQTDIFSNLSQAFMTLLSEAGMPDDTNPAQHQLMVDYFISAVAYSLENWDNSSITDSNYYEYISWSGGLTSTSTFNNKPIIFQQNVISANIAEGQADNEYNADIAKGSKNCN